MIDARETPASAVPVITHVQSTSTRQRFAEQHDRKHGVHYCAGDPGGGTGMQLHTDACWAARLDRSTSYHERIRLEYAQPPIGHPGSLFDFRL